ncbi:hypothetical protein [Novosphingobium lindaniclasticum]
MKRPARTLALVLLLTATGIAGCRIIPEGSAPPSVTPAPASPYAPPAESPDQPSFYTPQDTAPGDLVPSGPAPSGPSSPSPEPSPPPASYSGPPLAYTRIGETIHVDGPRVTPLALLEDSRCAVGTQCVWAGRLRVRVRVDLGSGPREVEMTLGQPIQIADGQLELLDALPAPVAGTRPAPFAYQFGFRFMGGL